MAICNRDLDQSEKIKVLDVNKEALLVTGATLYAAMIPYPAKLHKMVLAGNGVSGTPTYNLEIHRFVAAGLTVITPGSALTVGANFGTSGVASATFNSGSTLSQLLANDVLVLKSGGANSAVLQLQGGIVIEALQDIKTSFGV